MYTLTSSLIFIYTQMFYIFFYIKQKICIILNYLNLNYPIQPINKVSIIEYTNTSKFKRLTINFYDYLDDIDKYNDSKYVLIHEKLYQDIMLIKLNNINNNHDDYSLCNYSFMLVQIKYPNGDVYDITQYLKNYKVNFYLVGNILFDKDFIIWFSINYFNIDYDNYEITIIDNLLEKITMNEKYKLQLSLDDYKILKKSVD